MVQQDNAGPHIEEGYRLWTQHIFDNLGWLYEPQAPQGIRTLTLTLTLTLTHINEVFHPGLQDNEANYY